MAKAWKVGMMQPAFGTGTALAAKTNRAVCHRLAFKTPPLLNRGAPPALASSFYCLYHLADVELVVLGDNGDQFSQLGGTKDGVARGSLPIGWG